MTKLSQLHKTHLRMAVIFFLLLIGIFVPRSTGAEFHVSPSGSDTNTGTAEKPFATLFKAQKAVRDLLVSGPPAESVSVILHEGIYRQSEPLVFLPEDSGTKKYPVVWMAAPGTKPVISGGKTVSGWKKFNDRLYVADYKHSADDGPWQMYVNNRLATLARTPNVGSCFYTQRLVYQGNNSSPCLGFKYEEKDAGSWLDDPNVQIVQYHHWSNSWNRIKSVDQQRRLITYTRNGGAHAGGPEVRYYITNSFDSLDEPGEWYYDRGKSKLFYYPLPNENPTTMTIDVPLLEASIVLVKGVIEKGKPVSHLVFRGLTFEHTDAGLSADYRHSVQGAHTQRGAFSATGMDDCVIEDCVFTNIGEHGISLKTGCHRNRISRNHIHNMGGGGVYLSEEVPVDKTDVWMTSHNIVDNNFIHDGGLVYAASCGVFMGGSANYNQITHNEICNMSWDGIHAGWSWSGTSPAWTHHNEIAWNHIHQIGNGVLSDIGAVYFLGISTGTVFHHNRIHNVSRFTRGREGYGGWGIYLDAGSSNIRIENNIVSDTQDGGLHLHCYAYPFGDQVTNNIFAFGRNGGMIRNGDMESKVGNHVDLSHNIVYEDGDIICGGYNWHRGSNFSTDWNCYWTTGRKAPLFGGRTFDDWKKEGNDVHSMIADPRFKDVTNRDFTLLPDSPALKLGFKPIDQSQIGLYGKEDWVQLPKKYPLRKVETAAAPKSVDTITDNFEEYFAGEIPNHTQAYDGNDKACVRVSKDQNNGQGEQSLKFIDIPGLQWQHDPHIAWQGEFPAGTLHNHFELRLDKKAILHYEWRDYPQSGGYNSGPTFNATVQNGLQVNGQKLVDLPLEQWIGIDVTCKTGDEPIGQWSLTVTLPDGTVKKFDNLVCGTKFHKLTWLGFISNANTYSVFYIDNFKLEAIKGDRSIF